VLEEADLFVWLVFFDVTTVVVLLVCMALTVSYEGILWIVVDIFLKRT
jgi:hypothetical protein